MTLARTIIVFATIFCFSVANAYDPDTVHKTINRSAAENAASMATLNSLLGYGSNHVLGGKSVLKWIEEGGRAEDDPESRGLWHFHDPLKPWDSAGLLGTFKSSILFAQDAQSNGFTWQRARSLYYEGLVATDSQTRDAKLALMFKNIGQIMHLISDMAVPAHARNDQHLFSEPYERYTRGKVDVLR